MSIRPCCATMGALMSEVGEKGFSVLPVHEGKRRSLVLQSRAVDKDGVEELKKPLAEWQRPVPIAIAMNLPLEFCPNCGTKLDVLIRDQLESFDQDAEALAYLVPMWRH